MHATCNSYYWQLTSSQSRTASELHHGTCKLLQCSEDASNCKKNMKRISQDDLVKDGYVEIGIQTAFGKIYFFDVLITLSIELKAVIAQK